jgi:hypothetical protein
MDSLCRFPVKVGNTVGCRLVLIKEVDWSWSLQFLPRNRALDVGHGITPTAP